MLIINYGLTTVATVASQEVNRIYVNKQAWTTASGIAPRRAQLSKWSVLGDNIVSTLNQVSYKTFEFREFKFLTIYGIGSAFCHTPIHTTRHGLGVFHCSIVGSVSVCGILNIRTANLIPMKRFINQKIPLKKLSDYSKWNNCILKRGDTFCSLSKRGADIQLTSFYKCLREDSNLSGPLTSPPAQVIPEALHPQCLVLETILRIPYLPFITCLYGYFSFRPFCMLSVSLSQALTAWSFKSVDMLDINQYIC